MKAVEKQIIISSHRNLVHDNVKLKTVSKTKVGLYIIYNEAEELRN